MASFLGAYPSYPWIRDIVSVLCGEGMLGIPSLEFHEEYNMLCTD